MANLNLVPGSDEVFAACGNFAGAIYSNRAFTYYRVVRGAKERMVVVNGMVVEHTYEYEENKLERSEMFVGEWAFKLALKSQLHYKLIRSQSVGSWYNERKVS